MTDRKEVKKIPYGMTDYKLVRDGNYYYLDKTRYIQMLEDVGSFLFFKSFLIVSGKRFLYS